MRGEIRVDRLTWRPLGRSAPTVADLSLTISPGGRVLVVGASGAGKSTLLLALAGALGPTVAGDLSGGAHVDGRIGLVVQNPLNAVVAERVGRDVAFGLENAAVPRGEIWPQVSSALATMGFGDAEARLVSTLSGGELQRTVLAGVLVTRPDVLLLDEPTSMLDAANAAAARDAVIQAAGDRTLVVVEHRIDPWLEHVDRVIALAPGGRIAFDGSPAEFVGGPALPGVWMPGMALPSPLAIPSVLVEPSDGAEPVEADDLHVTLTTRTLRGIHRTEALRGLSARLEPGQLTTLVGPSGAGKSTALAVLGGLLRPSAGQVTPNRSRLASRRLAAEVGWVPQNPEHGFVAATVADEVGRTGRRIGRAVDASAVLETFGLSGYASVNPFRLSGGEQRRLALAAGLAHRPGLMLLDEPTVGQDPSTWAAVTGWMAAARDAGAVVAASTHDAALVADVELRLRAGVCT